MHLSRRFNRVTDLIALVSINASMVWRTMCTTSTCTRTEFDEIKDIIDQTADLWKSSIHWWRTFAVRSRRDLTLCCQQGFYVTITTNGTLIGQCADVGSIPSDVYTSIFLDGNRDATMPFVVRITQAYGAMEAIRDADAVRGNSNWKIL